MEADRKLDGALRHNDLVRFVIAATATT